jgi:hypothetical protein
LTRARKPLPFSLSSCGFRFLYRSVLVPAQPDSI